MRGYHSRTVISAIAALLAFGSHAYAADALIEGGRLCTQQFPIQEQRNNIPTHLLAAISTTESGRWHDGLGMAVPWPWTINVEGKGYYFNSKAEAIARVQQLQATGHQSIDVGCMQVNLKHHAKAFANLEDAFDPASNVAYAAKFLHDNYAELGDWIKATAAYHSRTQVYGQRYLVDIERSWNRIVAKVAAARAGTSTVNTPTATANAAAPTRNEQIADAAPEMTRGKSVAMKPLASAHNVQVVKVNEVQKSAPDVLVIRGAADPRTVTPVSGKAVAAATPAAKTIPQSQVIASADRADETMIMQPAGDSVRRVTLDNHTPSALKDTASQSKFVFAN